MRYSSSTNAYNVFHTHSRAELYCEIVTNVLLSVFSLVWLNRHSLDMLLSKPVMQTGGDVCLYQMYFFLQFLCALGLYDKRTQGFNFGKKEKKYFKLRFKQIK